MEFKGAPQCFVMFCWIWSQQLNLSALKPRDSTLLWGVGFAESDSPAATSEFGLLASSSFQLLMLMGPSTLNPTSSG